MAILILLQIDIYSCEQVKYIRESCQLNIHSFSIDADYLKLDSYYALL